MSSTAPAPEDILGQIAAYDGWRHRIEVAPGIFTPGRNCAGKLRLMDLPERLDGLRVLDIGAADGFFSFECERRGAAEVVALDTRHPYPAGSEGSGFNLAKAALGSRVRHVRGSLYDADLGTFDLVLCLNVLYHVPEVLLAVRRLRDYTRIGARVVIATLVMDQGLVLPDGSTSPIADVAPALKDAPLMQFLPAVAGWEDRDSSFWQISSAALTGMLGRVGFEVERMKLGGADRAYITARAVERKPGDRLFTA